MRDHITIEEFNELCAARRERFVSFEDDEKTYREFLARNSFNASEIKLEIEEARVERKARALIEFNSRSNAA